MTTSSPFLMRFLQVALLGVVLLIISPFLLPIALAFIFASILWPWSDSLSVWIRNQTLRAALLTIAFTSLILGPVLTMLGGGVFILHRMASEGQLEQFDFHPGHWIRDFLEIDWVDHWQGSLGISDEQVRTTVLSVLQKVQAYLIQFLQAILGNTPQAVLAFVVMVLCLFWILKDRHRIESWIHRHSPWSANETKLLIETFRSVSVAVVSAGILSGLAQASILSLGSRVSGLGNPGVVALIVFFASFFPFMGAGLVSLVLILLGVISGDFSAVFILLPFSAISSVVDNLIYPWVVGGRAEINPLVSFLAVVGGIQLFGIFGIFLGPITFVMSLKVLSLLAGDDIARPPTPKKAMLSTRLKHWLNRWAPRRK